MYNFLTYSQMKIYIQNSIVTIFHCYCVKSVVQPLHLQDIIVLAWLLRCIVCFAGQNGWMSEANRSKCSPYIYQQCYCFLYGCLNSYSGFKSIFTPSTFISYFVSSYFNHSWDEGKTQAICKEEETSFFFRRRICVLK